MGQEIGIITSHAGYNFGSVLQAYATQTAVENLGYTAVLINYRRLKQHRCYYPLYRTEFGIKVLAKDLTQVFVHKKRRLRRDRYEQFFLDHFKLTPQVREPEEVAALWQKYSVMVSGSDQIWNKNACELSFEEWSYMDPYLLKGFQGKKVSYASSIGDMPDEGLQRILPELKRFDAISFRETTAQRKMAPMLERPAAVVLDPTFLLKKEEWIERLSLCKTQENYVLAYFLGNVKLWWHYIGKLTRFAQIHHTKIKLITPLASLPVGGSCIELCADYGPVEFLNAVYNAQAVITNSYHGTILSVNFGKEFYSCCRSCGQDYRKTDILERLGLMDRVVDDAAPFPGGNLPPIEYGPVYEKLDLLREQSMAWLGSNLKDSKTET